MANFISFVGNLDSKTFLCSGVCIDSHREGGVPYKSDSESA